MNTEESEDVSPSPDEFRKRFALATFSDGGIVVNVETGGYWMLNSSGAVLLSELERSRSADEAFAAAATRLGIPRELAARDIAALIRQANGKGIPELPIGPFRYQASPEGGYELWDAQRAVLRTDESGRRLSLLAPPASLPFRVYDYVSEMAPKLMSLQGVTVLHGSGVRRGPTSLGMCGASRAGKTTTARNLAKYGRQLIAEDLLVFDSDVARPRICVGGEATVHAWTKEASSRLEEREGASVDASSIADAATGPKVDMGALWFLDARRRGERFVLEPVPKAEALSMLVVNAFLGASDSANWRRYLAAGAAIIAVADAYEAYLPNGIEALDAAISRYTTNSAS